MRSSALCSLGFVLVMALAPNVSAQADSFCSEFGGGGIVWATANVVYGRVEINNLKDPNRFPKITVSLIRQGSTLANMAVGKSGNYCFRNVNGAGATLVLAVEEAEVGRVDLPSSTLASNQFRQDMAVDLGARTHKVGVVSAKYAHSRDPKNEQIFTAASALLKEKKTERAIPLLRQIVESDSKDFVSWALLGSAYFEKNDLPAAESAYLSSLEANPSYVVAMTNLGHIYMIQKKLDPAVALLNRATEIETGYARAYRLLGEALLLSKKGKLGLEALYRAIEIDPIGMAECHLLAARLFESAGAKNYAAREYKLFLDKVPEHPQKKQFQKYIQENPPAEN